MKNKFSAKESALYKRNKYLQQTYGINNDYYQQMVLNQEDKCKLCGKRYKSKYYLVDHDHKTGKVRGLLCSQCNKKLGKLENSEWIKRALLYIRGKL